MITITWKEWIIVKIIIRIQSCYNTNNGPAVFRLKEHLERLHYSANSFKMNIPFSVNDLHEGIIQLIKANNIKDCYLRPIAFYGHDTLGVHPKKCPVQIAIATLDWGAYISKEALAKGARITISPWKKFQFDACKIIIYINL